MSEIFSTAFLMGGLGNQMFQIANAYAQSLDGNVKCYFEPKSETNLQGNSTEYYIDNIFKKINFKEKLPKVKRYNEPDFSYNQKKFDWKESIEFYGYYQSSKNFLTYSEQIRSLFEPNLASKNYLLKRYPQITEENTLSIHVRLGDFKKFPNIHPVISTSYIDKSVNQFPNYSNMFVFSDDKEWVYKNLKFRNIIIVEEKDYFEMWLMSMCKNNIISNSTFSWWGSYLNSNSNKKIIAPSNWFGIKGPKNFSDIFEDDWIKI